MSDRSQVREIFDEVERITGCRPQYLNKAGGKHPKMLLTILNTPQVFPLPQKELKAGCSKNNFYGQMRQKINERIEAVRARQVITN